MVLSTGFFRFFPPSDHLDQQQDPYSCHHTCCIDTHIPEFAASSRHKRLMDLVCDRIQRTKAPCRQSSVQKPGSNAQVLSQLPPFNCIQHTDPQYQIFRKMSRFPYKKGSCIRIQAEQPHCDRLQKRALLRGDLCRHRGMNKNNDHHHERRQTSPYPRLFSGRKQIFHTA